MKCLRLVITIVFINSIWGLRAQNYPQFTTQPLKLSPDISGSFGEMRSHHFHLGMDFRTQRKEGWNVYSIGDGYVKRIKISHYGYGKLIQIQHPNGYVSHYGHLSNYATPIDEYVKKIQYELQSYEFEIFPEPGLIPVHEGQIIAYSGNTGGSTGPHLHFEIRDSTNGWVFNPLLFGIKMLDTKNPQITGIRFYTGGQNPITYSVHANKHGTYYINGGKALNALGYLKFSFLAKDLQNGSGFRNGIYHTQLLIDDSLAFEYKMEKIKIDDQRTSDFHMDYENWIDRDTYYEKLWFDEESPLEIYNRALRKNWYQFSEGYHTVLLKLTDYYGNHRELSFKVYLKKESPVVDYVEPSKYFVYFDREMELEFGGSLDSPQLKFILPKYSMFQNTDKVQPIIMNTPNKWGELDFQVGSHDIPVHNSFTIEVKTQHQLAGMDKLFLLYHRHDGKDRIYIPSGFNGDRIVTEVHDLGKYSVWADTTAPYIKKINLKDSASVYNGFVFQTTATDNLTDVATYNAYIDGQWHLTSYEYKADLLSTPLPQGLEPGYHTFEIEVFDSLLNRTYRRIVFRILS